MVGGAFGGEHSIVLVLVVVLVLDSALRLLVVRQGGNNTFRHGTDGTYGTNRTNIFNGPSHERLATRIPTRGRVRSSIPASPYGISENTYASRGSPR
jgi:hypothetical protein